jgi:hypothetical protein
MTTIILFAIMLTWQDNSFNESGFNIEKTISGNCTDGFVKIVQVSSDITSWVDNLAQPGDCYRVNAFNSDGTSGYTNTAQVPVVNPPPPPCRNKGKKCR